MLIDSVMHGNNLKHLQFSKKILHEDIHCLTWILYVILQNIYIHIFPKHLPLVNTVTPKISLIALFPIAADFYPTHSFLI